MSKDMIGWKPMEEDFQSLTFNSYGSGQMAAHLPYHLLSSQNQRQSLKLYIEGFPSDLTETGLKNFLNRIGCQFLRVQIVCRKDLKSQPFRHPFGFIDFESTIAAQKGIELIKTQKIFKLLVYFTATQTELKEREDLKDKEFQEFEKQVYEQNTELKAEDIDSQQN